MAQYRTLREIAKRMKWKSPSKVLRRHKLDDFPLYPDWTKRGLIWVTSDELILKWEEKKVQMSQGARLRSPRRRRHKPDYQPYNWRLRDENRTDSGTTVGPQFKEENEQTPYARHEHKCPTVCEEPSELGPTNHELTPAQREELGIPKLDVIAPETPVSTEDPRPIVDAGFPPTTQPHPALTLNPSCTCGTLTPCIAHD